MQNAHAGATNELFGGDHIRLQILGPARFRPNTIALLSLLIPIIGTLGLSISMIIKALKGSP